MAKRNNKVKMFGRSNDKPARVKKEMRAAEWFASLIDEWRKNGPAKHLPRGARYGWEYHAEELAPPVAISRRSSILDGWLLREMFIVRADLPDEPMHDDREWPWDPARTIAEQEESAAFGRFLDRPVSTDPETGALAFADASAAANDGPTMKEQEDARERNHQDELVLHDQGEDFDPKRGIDIDRSFDDSDDYDAGEAGECPDNLPLEDDDAVSAPIAMLLQPEAGRIASMTDEQIIAGSASAPPRQPNWDRSLDAMEAEQTRVAEPDLRDDDDDPFESAPPRPPAWTAPVERPLPIKSRENSACQRDDCWVHEDCMDPDHCPDKRPAGDGR